MANGGIIGQFADDFGLSNASDQAQAYKSDPNQYKWQGPSQGQLGSYLSGAQNQAGQDYGNQEAARQGQGNYLAQLQQIANGNGPSQATAVLQQGADRAASQSMSLARSGGGNPAAQAANMRAAMNVGAAGMTSSGADAARIKAQEQENAMNQMGGVLSGMRGQDLQSMGMGNQMTGTYLGGQMGVGNATLGAGMSQDQLDAQSYNAAQDVRAGANAQNATTNGKLLAAGASAVGTLAMSDFNAKTDIAPAGISDVDPTMGGDLGTPAAAAAFAGGGAGGGMMPGGGGAAGALPDAGASGGLGGALKAFGDSFNGVKDDDKDKRRPSGPAKPTIAQALGVPQAPGIPGGATVASPWQTFGGAPEPQTFVPQGQLGPLAVNADAYGNTGPNLGGPGHQVYDLPEVSGNSTYSDERLKEGTVSEGTKFTERREAPMYKGHNESSLLNRREDPGSGSRVVASSGERNLQTLTRDDENGEPVHYAPNAARENQLGLSGQVLYSDERVKFTEPREATQYKSRNNNDDGMQRAIASEREFGMQEQRLGRGAGVEHPRQRKLKADPVSKRMTSDFDSVEGDDIYGDGGIYSDEHLKKLGISKADMALLDKRVEDTPERRQRIAETDAYTSRARKAEHESEQWEQRQFEENHPEMAYRNQAPPLDESMGSEADHFLNHLHPYTYRYKDPSYEPTSQPNGGHYLGVMAQDVEKTPVGQQIVKDTPRGKMLEGGALMSAMAAGLGRLHERVSGLEGKR